MFQNNSLGCTKARYRDVWNAPLASGEQYCDGNVSSKPAHDHQNLRKDKYWSPIRWNASNSADFIFISRDCNALKRMERTSAQFSESAGGLCKYSAEAIQTRSHGFQPSHPPIILRSRSDLILEPCEWSRFYQPLCLTDDEKIPLLFGPGLTCGPCGNSCRTFAVWLPSCGELPWDDWESGIISEFHSLLLRCSRWLGRLDPSRE